MVIGWIYGKQNNTVDYSAPIQLKLPVDLERIIKKMMQCYHSQPIELTVIANQRETGSQ